MDAQSGASHPGSQQCLMQRAGQRASGKRRGVDPVDRRIALQHRIELGRQLAPRRPAFLLAAGEPVCAHRVGAEPGGDIRTRQRGELTDRSNSHPPQQICQISPPRTGQTGLGGELPNRQRRQKTRVIPRRHDAARAGGEDRRRQPIGDPDLTLGAGRRHCVGQPLGNLLLGPEKPGRPADRHDHQAGAQHLGARHQVVYRRDNSFEVAGVAVGIGGDDVQLRAAGRCLAPPQPSPHTYRTGRRRTGDHPVGQRDGDR